MPTLSQLEQARARILPFVNRTPLLRSTTLSEELGCQVWIKAEMFRGGRMQTCVLGLPVRAARAG